MYDQRPSSFPRPSIRRCLAASLACGASAAAYAGEVTLTTGESLEGRVTAQTAATVTVSHPVLGDLPIPRSSIRGLVLDADDVPTPDGVAPAAAGAEDQADADHGGGTGSATATPQAPAQPQAAPEPEPWLPWFLPTYERSIDLGLNGSEGNSQTFNVTAGFAAKEKTDQLRTDLTARYFRNTSDNETTKDQGNITALRDWLEPGEDHFYFARGMYDYDQFQAFEHRVGAQVGVGYDFLDDDEFQLTGRAGVGPQYEFGDVNELTVEALLGVEFGWDLADNQRFTFANTYFQAFDDIRDFRNVTTAAYRVTLDEANGLSLKLGLENEYEARPAPGDEKNDLTYFATLVLDF